MEFILENISKRYIHDWIFKNVKAEITEGSKWAIVGPNGSGKSTLLQIISGFRLPSNGRIVYKSGDKEVSADEIYKHISFASPYLELIEELSPAELLEFQFSFRTSQDTFKSILDMFELGKATHKPIKYFSSGMKQRMKLAIALGSESGALLLDEPTANLDEQGKILFHKNLEKYLNNRTLIIASNEQDEYTACNKHINISNFKS